MNLWNSSLVYGMHVRFEQVSKHMTVERNTTDFLHPYLVHELMLQHVDLLSELFPQLIERNSAHVLKIFLISHWSDKSAAVSLLEEFLDLLSDLILGVDLLRVAWLLCKSVLQVLST